MAEVPRIEDYRDPRDRPLGELVKELSEEASALIRQELELAKIELADKGRKAAAGGALLSAGLLFAHLSLAVFSAAAVLALTLVFQPWLAAVIVGAAYLVLAAILLAVGKRELGQAGSPVPEETVQTIREDAEWIRRRNRSAAR
jgi:uncharacterized membrane protein YqjE